MQEEIQKSRRVIVTIPQTTNIDNLFREWVNPRRKVKIVPEEMGGDPMEVIVRDIAPKTKAEPMTGTYVPPKKEREKVGTKRGLIKKIGDSLIP